MIKLRHVFFAFLLAVVAIAVGAQWGQWGTGRAALEQLSLVPGGPAVTPPGRIWIDTDAACGASARTDPDDCLAILWLVSHGVDIVGLARQSMRRLFSCPGDNRTGSGVLVFEK